MSLLTPRPMPAAMQKYPTNLRKYGDRSDLVGRWLQRRRLLHRLLCWRQGQLAVPLAKLAARAATALQMRPVQRQRRHAEFARVAARLSRELLPAEGSFSCGDGQPHATALE